MNRLPRWASISIGVVLFLVALMGITNSVHAMARVVYAALIVVSLAIIYPAIRRRGVTDAPREPVDPAR